MSQTEINECQGKVSTIDFSTCKTAEESEGCTFYSMDNSCDIVND